MLVKVLIKRRFKPHLMQEGLAMLREFRLDAMDQSGYISGETMVSASNPREIMVIGTWQRMEDWLRWKEDDSRKKLDLKLSAFQEGPTVYEAFFLGGKL